MTMQRQHFELIAEVIRETMADRDIDDCVKEPMTRHMAQKFARRLASTNPNFNEARFLRACGVSGDG